MTKTTSAQRIALWPAARRGRGSDWVGAAPRSRAARSMTLPSESWRPTSPRRHTIAHATAALRAIGKGLRRARCRSTGIALGAMRPALPSRTSRPRTPIRVRSRGGRSPCCPGRRPDEPERDAQVVRLERPERRAALGQRSHPAEEVLARRILPKKLELEGVVHPLGSTDPRRLLEDAVVDERDERVARLGGLGVRNADLAAARDELAEQRDHVVAQDGRRRRAPAVADLRGRRQNVGARLVHRIRARLPHGDQRK